MCVFCFENRAADVHQIDVVHRLVPRSHKLNKEDSICNHRITAIDSGYQCDLLLHKCINVRPIVMSNLNQNERVKCRGYLKNIFSKSLHNA